MPPLQLPCLLSLQTPWRHDLPANYPYTLHIATLYLVAACTTFCQLLVLENMTISVCAHPFTILPGILPSRCVAPPAVYARRATHCTRLRCTGAPARSPPSPAAIVPTSGNLPCALRADACHFSSLPPSSRIPSPTCWPSTTNLYLKHNPSYACLGDVVLIWHRRKTFRRAAAHGRAVRRFFARATRCRTDVFSFVITITTAYSFVL